MARVAPRVPDASDVLCERCGYVLNGLPEGARCPECGKPVAESVGDGRVPTAWDRSGPGGTGRAAEFIRTTVEVIRRPAAFYRTLAVRAPVASARSFARLNWWAAAGLFGVAGATHSMWYWAQFSAMRMPHYSPALIGTWVGFALGLTILTYLALDGITRLAGRLTHWEGTYRGYRLPYEIVLRGLYYHSPHYLPVAAVTATTVVGYQVLAAVHPIALEWAVRYLYVLGGEVVLGAVYLFQTYWIGMRNMMYANR